MAWLPLIAQLRKCLDASQREVDSTYLFVYVRVCEYIICIWNSEAVFPFE